MFRRLLSAIAVGVLGCALASATDFYAAPNGSPGGNGSMSNPWDLSTALHQPSAVDPGDTIWLRGGTYTGIHTSFLNGTSTNPIVVRQYPGERATLDGGDSNGVAILSINGSYTWFWGFEITSSDPVRQSADSGSWPTDINRGDGIDSGNVPTPGIKLINLTIHDARQGIAAFSNWSDTEIYGCLVYYNGWEGTDRGHGHGLYAQNQTGYKHITDSLFFSGFDHNIHVYGSDASYLDNFTFQGNTTWNAGDLSNISLGRNLLLGGSSTAHNPTVKDNMMYRPTSRAPASDLDMGYGSGGGCTNATVTNNYVPNNTYFVDCLPVTMTGNDFYGNIIGFPHSQYPGNTYSSTRPSDTKVFVRPNAYEAGRANISVFNWGLQDTVEVDLTGFAYVGSAFEIRNAENYFGAPVASGVYNGGAVSIPMSGLSVAAPVGWPAPPSHGPEFGAFILISLPGPYDFFDVAPSNPFHAAITNVARNGVSAGCGGGKFCPNATVARDQTAVFLLKGEHGSTFTPPSATGTVFADVPSDIFAASWIEQVATEGISTGCGSGYYCPHSAMTRAQMAVFLLKTKLGLAYAPPAATGTVFSDVAANAFAASWIEDLAARGITTGCGSGRFCPSATVTRGQMAVFLVNTFNLQ